MIPIAPLTLVDHEADKEKVRSDFARWQQALRAKAQRLGLQGPKAATTHERLWLLGVGPQVKLFERIEPQADGDGSGPRFKTATCRETDDDPTGGWIVHLGMSFYNYGSVFTRLATDGKGQTWLLRYGKLAWNGETEVDENGFRERFAPLPVLKPDGKTQDPGPWYPVAMLDAPDKEVATATAAFIRRCARIRFLHRVGELLQPLPSGASGDAAGQSEPPKQEGTLLPLVEPTDSFELPAQPSKIVQQKQGKVVEALRGKLNEHLVQNGKLPRVALLLNVGPGVLLDFGPPAVPQPTVSRVTRGAWSGLESQGGFVRAASPGA